MSFLKYSVLERERKHQVICPHPYLLCISAHVPLSCPSSFPVYPCQWSPDSLLDYSSACLKRGDKTFCKLFPGQSHLSAHPRHLSFFPHSSSLPLFCELEIQPFVTLLVSYLSRSHIHLLRPWLFLLQYAFRACTIMVI